MIVKDVVMQLFEEMSQANIRLAFIPSQESGCIHACKSCDHAVESRNELSKHKTSIHTSL